MMQIISKIQRQPSIRLMFLCLFVGPPHHIPYISFFQNVWRCAHFLKNRRGFALYFWLTLNDQRKTLIIFKIDCKIYSSDHPKQRDRSLNSINAFCELFGYELLILSKIREHWRRHCKPYSSVGPFSLDIRRTAWYCGLDHEDA